MKISIELELDDEVIAEHRERIDRSSYPLTPEGVRAYLLDQLQDVRDELGYVGALGQAILAGTPRPR
jgi:hypothetical protein